MLKVSYYDVYAKLLCMGTTGNMYEVYNDTADIMENKYNTVGTVKTSIRKITDKEEKLIPLTHMHDRSFSWLGTYLKNKMVVLNIIFILSIWF